MVASTPSFHARRWTCQKPSPINTAKTGAAAKNGATSERRGAAGVGVEGVGVEGGLDALISPTGRVRPC